MADSSPSLSAILKDPRYGFTSQGYGGYTTDARGTIIRQDSNTQAWSYTSLDELQRREAEAHKKKMKEAYRNVKLKKLEENEKFLVKALEMFIDEATSVEQAKALAEYTLDQTGHRPFDDGYDEEEYA